jgi:hypothetical protein
LGAIFAGLLLMLAAAGLPQEKPAEAAIHNWKTDLFNAQENPPVPAGSGAGNAEFFFDDAPNERLLQYFVTVTGIEAEDVTAAHIHRGLAGQNGPVIYPIQDPTGATSGITYFAGSVKLTEADVNDLRGGNLYVNVHSKVYPGGFARAQMYLPGRAAEAATRAAVKAWNDKNIPAFLAHWTDAALMSEFDASRAELMEFLPEFIGQPPITVRSISNVTQSANSASALIELGFGQVIEQSQVGLVLQNGVWKIDTFVDRPVPIPAGVTAVDVDLQEYAFVYNKAAITSGNIAFRVENIGMEDHEIALARIPAGADLMELLQMEEEDIPGFELIGQADYDAGDDGTMVFTGPLANGRYAMVCFFPSPQGVPHAFLGMVSEFNIGAATGGGAVRPPSTGDAGLLASSSEELSLSFLVLGAMAIVAGVGGLMVAVRRAR